MRETKASEPPARSSEPAVKAADEVHGRIKITAIRPYPVWVGKRNQLIVKVETSEGIFGWGESGLSGREKAVIGAIEHFAEFIIGRDPFMIGALWQEIYRSQYFEGGRVLQAAISAIDIALHDIKGKALGVPVYDLLGGKHRDIIPTFASTSAEPGPLMIEQAQKLVESGWIALRFFPAGQQNSTEYEPREHIAETAKWCVKAREELGATPVLGIDYHHRLSVAEAASFCQKMPSGTLDFLEEPIRDETPEAYESLRRMTDIPFAIGEEFASKWQFRPYIERGIHQFNRIDVCNVGGLTEAMKVAAWSETHYVDMMPHNPLGPVCTAATVHFAAAVPNFCWLETRTSPAELYGESGGLFPVQPQLKGAFYPVSDAPGLGVEVDEDLAMKQSFQFWEAPHLKRRDGSVTNW
jgi:galactonate dehydratase